MGFEYMLDFEVDDPIVVDARLRGVDGFEAFDSDNSLYVFRRRPEGGMPDACAKLEKNGVYLCDNGGGQAIVQDVRDSIAMLAPGVTLREL